MSTFFKNIPSEDIEKFISFVTESPLNENSKPSEIKQKTGEYYALHFKDLSNDKKLLLKESFEGFSFFDVNNIKPEEVKNEELFKAVMTLSQAKHELIDKLSEHKTRVNFGELKRKASPPLEAYNYTGNNKLNITSSKKSYGLLFE